MGGTGVLAVAREVQIPLLAVLLIGGCAAKARRAIGARSIDAGIGPTAMFPFRLQRPAAIAICASEFGLGIGLLVTAGRIGAGWPADAVRAATALLFCTAVAALAELRTRRPDAGCGCFGDVSSTPVGWRTITRAALLGAAALASIGVPPLHMLGSPDRSGEVLAVTVAELALLAALSPEIGELMVRLGHAEPCEVRRVPVARTLRHALRQRSLAALPPPPDQHDADRRVARRMLAIRGLPGRARQPPRRGGLRRLPDGPPRPGPGGRARRRYARPRPHPPPLQLSNRV